MTTPFALPDGILTDQGALSTPGVPPAAMSQPSPGEILASLRQSEDAGVAGQLILAAESLRFEAPEAEALKPLLLRYIERHYTSERSEERVAVASAVRKYVALLSIAELPLIAHLLRADRKSPPHLEMEVAKMVTRKLMATLPEDTLPLQSLGDELMDLVAGYATPRMLPKRYCGAVALDAMLSLALLRSPHMQELTNRVKAIPLAWFRATVARQARLLRTDLFGRFGAERCDPAAECLAALAVAVESPSGT